MCKLAKYMKDKDIATSPETRIVKAIVFPVMMYGCESWTIREAERKKIDSFKIWCWRRILRVPWAEKRTNRFIIEQKQRKISLEAMIIKLWPCNESRRTGWKNESC